MTKPLATATVKPVGRPRAATGFYKVRTAAPNAYVIGLPRDFGERLLGKTFTVHVTDEGLLFVPIDTADSSSTEELENATWLS